MGPDPKVRMGDHFYEVKGNDRATALPVKADRIIWIVLKNIGKFEHHISWGRNLIDKGNYYDGYRENLLKNVQVKITSENWRLVANGLPDFYLGPGQEAELEMTLPAEVIGEWEMGCFRPNHHESGMHLKFIVEQSKPDFRLWHITDIETAQADFRFRGLNGHQNRGCRLPLMTLTGH